MSAEMGGEIAKQMIAAISGLNATLEDIKKIQIVQQKPNRWAHVASYSYRLNIYYATSKFDTHTKTLYENTRKRPIILKEFELMYNVISERADPTAGVTHLYNDKVETFFTLEKDQDRIIDRFEHFILFQRQLVATGTDPNTPATYTFAKRWPLNLLVEPTEKIKFDWSGTLTENAYRAHPEIEIIASALFEEYEPPRW